MQKPTLSPGEFNSGITNFIKQLSNMKKALQLTLLFALFAAAGFAQSGKYWSDNVQNRGSINKDKAIARLSFPTEFKLFNLNIEPLRQELFTLAGRTPSKHSTIISLPNTAGQVEDFEVFEASNFEPALQEQFPNIRAYSGKGITDRSATLKLSISPQGIQTMIFRTEKENEFIEPYSQDHKVYAVFNSQRKPGQLPWTCSTEDKKLVTDINSQIGQTNLAARSGGDLKTIRLAQSCNAEYSNYFGATSAAQVGLVLAAFNATLTRCNGVYEKDLALHLNLIANTTSVIYYTASSDPYTTMGSWNGQLQSTLTSVIGEANYDIGHMFGASGGGGNAGCIGCVCTNGSKGSGITSPADGIPQGDNFDIDYVVHEVGHQLGGNHTFSHALESAGVNKEVGSGITIMGYAGITSQDVAPHSIDIYHEATIAQIQANLLTKTCPVTTSITATNATPVVAAVPNYTIPRSTPFALTGSATDANAGDVLTYCWEQNDNSTVSGANSVASATKASGPNWISFSPTTSPTRYFPKLATILAGALISGPLPGGDASANTEALSSVARTLNFRLTVRDNAIFRSTAPVSVGQTSFTDMTVTVNAASGPFAVSAPNTAVSWVGGSSQTITWAVASTTAAPVSCANVKISLSTDGGQTFSTVLAASTANDGTETLVIPNTPSTTARIKIEAVGNIFFDISNTNFTITAGGSFSTINTSAIAPTVYCAGNAVSVPFTTNGAANAGNVFTAQLSNAAGSFASPISIGTLTGTGSGTIAATIPANTTADSGYRIRVVSSNPVVTGSDNNFGLKVNRIPTASTIVAAGPTSFCAGSNVVLNGNVGGTWNTGATTASITVSAAGNYFVTNTNSCGSVQSNSITVTVNPLPTASVVTASGSTEFCAGGSVVLSGNVGGTWNTGATTPSITATTSGAYFVTNTNGCGSVQSNSYAVFVYGLPTVSAGNLTTCLGNPVNLVGSPAGGTFSIPNPYSGPSTSYTYTYTNINGCTNTATGSVTVVPLPTVNAGTYGPLTTASAAITLAGTPAGGTFSGTGVSGNSFNPAVSGAGTFTITYTYTNGSGCTNSATTSIVVNPVACSFTAGTITGPNNGCPFMGPLDGNATYSINSVNASGYVWTVPSNAVIVSGQGTNSIVVDYSPVFVSGYVSVTVSNGCGGASTLVRLSIRSSIPGTAGVITGPTNACLFIGTANEATYTIRKLANTSSYQWTVPAGAVISGHPGGTGANDTIIKVQYNSGFVTGTAISVKGVSFCGTSTTARSLAITRTNPSTPGAIAGPTDVCPFITSATVATYSIASQANATSYIWAVPAGATITSHPGGVGTANDLSITVSFASNFTTGAITVTAVNNCANSSVRSLTVKRTPATPSVITGNITPCPSTTGAYSVTNVPGNTYTWTSTTPTTVSIVSGQGTNAVQIQFQGTFVSSSIRVTTTTACGTSSTRSLAVTNCLPLPKNMISTIVSSAKQEAVYPNPSNGDFKLFIQEESRYSGIVKVEVKNQLGQPVYQGNETIENGLISLNLRSQLTTGIYLVKSLVNGRSYVQKVIINR